MTRFGKRDESLPDLIAEAARAALSDAGLERPEVLVVGGEKMTHLPTPRVSEIIGRSIDPYERRYGTTMPALAGLVTRAAMHRHGLTLREFSQVAVKNHDHGARNPYAHFQQRVTI